MAAFVKYNSFINELSLGSHNLQTCVYKAALTDTAPTPVDTVWSAAVYPPPAVAGGYPTGTAR